MKKRIFLGLTVLILLLLIGCNDGGQKTLDFKPKDVMSIEVYNTQNTFPKKKTVTGEKDIKAVIDTFNAEKIIGEDVAEDKVYGGAMQLLFLKSDGSSLAIHYDGSTIMAVDTFCYEVEERSKIFDLWEQMEYDEQEIPKYDLPFHPKDQVPYLKIQFTSHGETGYAVATMPGCSWDYENEDGTMSGFEACGNSPLDSIDMVRKIEKTADMSELELIFTIPPESYTVRRWHEKYIGDAQENWQHYEVLNVSDNNIIILPDDGAGYVYEVHAKWQQGYSDNCFYVK